MHSLRKTILILLLALTTLIVTNSYAQPAEDHCGCCTEVQKMMCAACKVCVSPALLAHPATFATDTQHTVGHTVMALNPSHHTEDIWHPPKV
jgi:hypothetical protein